MSKRFFPFALTQHQQQHQQRAVALFVPNAVRAAAVTNTTGDPSPIDQQLADSFNANNAVLTYVIAMQNTTLPVVDATWYTTFSHAFSDAKAHALSWYDTISPNLIALPSGIANFASAFSLNMITINSYVTILSSDPTNAQAIAGLTSSIQSLLTTVQGQQTAVVAFLPILDNFATQLTADQSVMQNALVSATQQAGYDQNQVATLNADIATLQSDIAHWNTVITGVAIGGGIAIFLGCVGAIFSFGLGLIFAVASAIATITTIIVAQGKIRADTAQILQDQGQISTLNIEIASLQTLQANLNNLIALSGQAQQQFQLILSAWQTLEAEIQSVVTDLQAAGNDVTPLNLGQLSTDLSAASADWQTLLQFCNTIKGIQYTVLPGVTTLAA